MKKNILFRSTKNSFLLVLFMLLVVSFAHAATITSTATGGTWSVGTSWLGGVAPAATDTVIIATTAGNSVTLGGGTSIVNVTVNSAATLNIANRTLTTTGFFTNNGSVTGTTGVVALTGNFTNSGSFTLSTGRLTIATGNFSNTSTGTVTYTGAGRLLLGGNYSNAGTVTLLSALVQFTGTANQSIQSFTTTGTVSMLKTGGTATFTGNITGGGLTINGTGGTLSLVSGTHTFTKTWTRTAGTLNCGSSLLKIGTSVSGTGGTFIPGTGTVEYYRAGNQTAAVLAYNNLTLSGSGIKTFATTPTVNGKLTLGGTATVVVTTGVVTYGANATLQYDTTNIRTATSEEWVTPFNALGGIVINGTQIITLNTAKVMGVSSPLTITSVGKLATADLGLTFGGNFVNSGTLTAGSSSIDITNTMATQSIAGFTTTGLVTMTKTSGTATFGGNISGAGLTLTGAGTLNLGISLTHAFTGAITLTSGTLNGGSSTLNATFTGTAWAGTGSNFSCGTGTVNFGGAGQTLATASIFNKLIFSGSGTKTLTGVPTVNGTLSMEGTATVSAAPTYGANATLQYNRSVAQVSGLEWIATFVATGGVSIINTGIVTANGIKTINATSGLIIAGGATLDNGGFAISGASTLTVSNLGTLKVSGTSVFPVFTTTSLSTTSTVNYSGTAQTVAVKSYGILLLSNSGNKTFAGATTITGELGISGTAVALLLNGSTSTAGTLTFAGVLQTTLGSYGGTISPATNQNATWFGSTTTGIVNVLTSCLAGTWIGLTNTDWNTVGNWCGGSIPTASTDVTIGTAANQPIVGASGGLCRNITIITGATLTVSGSNTLTVSGNWTNNGSFVPNTSTVSFNGTTAQTIGGSNATTFNNLAIANTSAAVTATRGITVNAVLDIANIASVLDMSTFVLTAGGSFSTTGIGQLKTANTASTPIPTGKTWNNTVIFSSATGGQTVVAGTYNGTPALELDNTSGTQTASGNIVTGGQLNINNGGTPIFDMNGFNLTTNALNVVAPNSVLDMRGGTLLYTTAPSMDGKVRFSGITNGTPFSSGTVEYYGATQTVTAGDYFKLLFTGAGGVYTMASDVDVANTLTITNGGVTLQDGFALTVGDAVTVTNPGTLTIENNASLVQTTFTGANVGDIIVKRNTSPLLEYDFTFWASPTSGTQTLNNFAPNSLGDKFYIYDNDYINISPYTTVFDPGIGYVIRAAQGTSSSIPTVDTSSAFQGVPNNGTITIPVTVRPSDSLGERLIGNPYPSAIDADAFIDANITTGTGTQTISGTLYFWTHNSRPVGNNYLDADYATYTKAGGAGVLTGSANISAPTQFIPSGQGFFVEVDAPGDVVFDNTMRDINNTNTNFYKTGSTKKSKSVLSETDRIWLNLTNGVSGSQTLVTYITNATNDFDPGYDGLVYNDLQPFALFSLLGTDKLVIQGRALPFTDSDMVPLGYSINLAGDATIAIDHVDGLFLDDQGIYLEDKLTNVIWDLKSDPYMFTSEVGTFNDRFVLRYTAALGTTDFNALNKSVLVSKDKKELKITSTVAAIKQIAVFDVLGRSIFDKKEINANEFKTSTISLSNQIAIVKVTLEDGKILTKKVAF
ncbi:T9SS sorting signal type C domain-containing protein [Flavobacterium restrictum]|uniref:T9SS sorting signal type C domain-containing protein n=1 Tax=Flavobacterium restrictum TaxID=2594428 RepID=A0A553DVM6_9FLAO|nr:T9SS sorting signal type C domain-containing protein [Flavobacterium restrictum]TRX36703.1 T9SS sorting signal type C domain-containing protein [Flavobacterium restrictum]